MLDLFVISLTMSLINRDQFPRLYDGAGCGLLWRRAVILIYSFAVELLDSRLLWDAHESGKRPLRRLKPE